MVHDDNKVLNKQKRRFSNALLIKLVFSSIIVLELRNVDKNHVVNITIISDVSVHVWHKWDNIKEYKL